MGRALWRRPPCHARYSWIPVAASRHGLGGGAPRISQARPRRWTAPCGGCAPAAAGTTRRRCWTRYVATEPAAALRQAALLVERVHVHRRAAGPRRRRRCGRPRRSRGTTRNAGPQPANAANSPSRQRCCGYATGPTRHGPRSAGPRRCCRPLSRPGALLDFRRGLLAEHLSDTPQAARAAYQRRTPTRGPAPRRRAAGLLHLAPPRGARPAGRANSPSAARVHRIAAAA